MSMLIWMVVVGFAIGLVSSMFVRGTRMTGLIQTTLLAIAGYVIGWLSGELWGVSILGQWIVAIVVSLTLLVSYILLANAQNDRRAAKAQ